MQSSVLIHEEGKRQYVPLWSVAPLRLHSSLNYRILKGKALKRMGCQGRQSLPWPAGDTLRPSTQKAPNLAVRGW